MKEVFVEGSLIQWGHDFLSDRVPAGSQVVDATLGNGHDALFLSRLVGAEGQVFGFDIQPAAIEQSRVRLEEGGVPSESYQLFCCSHARMKEQVGRASTKPVHAVMFNLGYLPGSDKSVITQVESTLKALSQSLDVLAPGGVFSVMCYPGHSGGDSEAEEVLSWMRHREGRFSECYCVRRMNGSERSPFLLIAVMSSD